MTTEQCVDIIRFFVDNKMEGKTLSVEELNSLLELSAYNLYEEVYGMPGSPKGYETEQQNGDILNWFKTTSSIALTVGVGTLPTDYQHWASCLTGTATPVELVTEQEWEQRSANALTLPSTRYPIAKLYPTTIKVYPTSITSVSLTYLRKPIVSTYALKTENGVTVYDSATSLQIDFPASKHMDFIRHMLKLLGISVNDQQVISYVEQKQQQTT